MKTTASISTSSNATAQSFTTSSTGNPWSTQPSRAASPILQEKPRLCFRSGSTTLWSLKAFSTRGTFRPCCRSCRNIRRRPLVNFSVRFRARSKPCCSNERSKTPAQGFPLIFKRLLDVPANYHVVTEWKKEDSGKTRRVIQTKRRHFHNTKRSFFSQVSLNNMAPHDTLLDDSKESQVRELGKGIEEIELFGNYFGEF